jgi:hypothetical protein
MSGLEMLNGQFGQPTSLGCAVLGMGLTLAAANVPNDTKTEQIADPAPHIVQRGRSRYAESLHGTSNP